MLQRCKILGRTNSFTLKYIEIRKHFLKYRPPPRASKSFCLYTCYHILHIVWKWLAGTRGGVQLPQNPGPKPILHKMHFLPNKKLMTVMKFSRTNLLNCFVFYASLIYCAYRLKAELARFMHFFHKKKSHSDLMTHFFANVLYYLFAC